MEQTIPLVEEIAKLVDLINHKNNFTWLKSDYFDFRTSVEHKNAMVLTTSFLTKLSYFLKSKTNSVEKKEYVAKAIDMNDKDQAKFWETAKKIFSLRNSYLPLEHTENCLTVAKEFIRTPKAKELYSTLADYSINQIGKDYSNLNDAAKISAEKLYWHDLFVDSISDKGLVRLEEEKTRYRQALALIPAEFVNKYPQFALSPNPIEYLLLVLKAYSDDLIATVVN